MKPSLFLTLVKEERIDDDEGDHNELCSDLRLRLTHRSPPNMTDSMQALDPISGATVPSQPTNLNAQELETNLEPLPRARSYTWPACPETIAESKHVDGTSGIEQRSITSNGTTSGLLEPSGTVPKKNTSRRNPWGNMSYADLIAQAIVSSDEGRATLSQIYDWMVLNIPYFKDKGDSNSSAGWKNSIRHNLSLHSRFMRIQNEGTGKSSWWILNPDAKPGKSTRRRANTLEGGRYEKTTKRGRARKKIEAVRNGLEATPSPSSSLTEGLDCFPESPLPSHRTAYQLSPQDYRQRASSNASSCGRLSPIQSVDSDMHDSQVPPISPGAPLWSHPDYWAAHPHAPYPLAMGNHNHNRPYERYSDQLVESMGESLKLGGVVGETWVPPPPLHPPPPNMMPSLNPLDCMKATHPHQHGNSHLHHVNGHLTPHHLHQHIGCNNYDEYSMFGPHIIQGPNYPHANANHLEKHPPQNRHLQSLHSMSPLQTLSPAHNAHSLSPTSPTADRRFSSPSCEGEVRPTPTFITPPLHMSGGQTQTTNAITTSVNPCHGTPTNPLISKTKSHSPSVIHHQGSLAVLHHQLQRPGLQHSSSPHVQQPTSSEGTAMLKIALSHRDPSTAGPSHSFPSRHGPGITQVGNDNDLVDLDSIQGVPFDCNVDEVIKHELQYGDHLTFDFQHSQYAHNHSIHGHHSYSNGHFGSNRDSPSQMPVPSGPASVMQNYSRSTIAAGNQWVR